MLCIVCTLYTIIFDANSITISRIHYVLVAVSVGSLLSLLFLRVFLCVVSHIGFGSGDL